MVKMTRIQAKEQRNKPVTALQLNRAYRKLFGPMPETRTYTECASDICKHFQDEYRGYLFIREQSNDPTEA